MAAFSYQHHHPFLIDSSNSVTDLPTPTNTAYNNNKMFGFLEEPNNTLPASCFSHHQYFYQPQPAAVAADPLGEVSSLNYSCSTVAAAAAATTSSAKVSLTSSCSNNNSSSGDQATQKITPPPPPPTGHNKRKQNYDATSSAAQSMDSGEVLAVKGKKQRKINTNTLDEEKKKSRGGAADHKQDDENKKKKNNNKNKAPSEEEEAAAPTEYIQVRARRGQATDSHSLAERARREKISERMKLLQALVPGCEKVTGKALMLDEIINYVQSLQSQVEFLSMKLASLDPMFNDFGVDIEAFMAKPERMSSLEVAAQQTNVQDCSPNQSTTNTFTTTPNNYPSLDSSTLLLLQQGQMPNILSQSNGQLLWDVDEVHGQRIISQSSGFTINNSASFH